MYIYLPEPECSKCGQKHSETFQRKDCSGRRCLQCGHENIERAPADSVGGVPYQLNASNIERTF